MKRLLLAQTQRNDVLEILTHHGLNPSDFQWREAPVDPVPGYFDAAHVSEIAHRSTEYQFRFDLRGNNDHMCHFSPGPNAPEEFRPCDNWHTMLVWVKQWALRLKQELDAPDLWAPYLVEDRFLRASIAAGSDGTFTKEEKPNLHAALDQIKHQLLDHIGVQEEFRSVVSERFDYLKEAADRSRRPDWINIFLGTMLGLIVTVAIPAEEAREWLGFASDALSDIFEFVKHLP